MRVGIGYDSHRYAAGRDLVLGGVRIDWPHGLDGHSDADAVAHAVTDAVLGAAGLGDIGMHFPPTDDRWRGADSIGLLRAAVDLLAESNYQVVNVDVTVVSDGPRIGPYAEAMRARVGAAIGIAPGNVSIKGKSNEGLGWIGRNEGIAVMAVALVDLVAETPPFSD
jgi:2-C-methyl-D-erythritol 2,4-cyclodiphosphate synthase